MTKERLFKPAYAAELFRIAQSDYDTACILSEAKKGRKENALFHMGQAIEKTVKAVLCKLGVSVPLTHELSILIDRIPKNYPIPHGEDIADLSQFATIRRYEEGVAELTEEEVRAALSAARDVLEWGRAILSNKPPA